MTSAVRCTLRFVHAGGAAAGGPGRGRAGAQPVTAATSLRPVRTLVVSADPAYRERADAVLRGLGSVALADAALREPDAIAALVAQRRADVVVLDATGCEAAARAVIATLAQTAPRAGVVVVCQHCTDAARALGALPKWGWTKDLRCGVERARRDGNPLRPTALRSLPVAAPRRRVVGARAIVERPPGDRPQAQANVVDEAAHARRTGARLP